MACTLILAELYRAGLRSAIFKAPPTSTIAASGLPGRRVRFSAGWGTLLTNDFRGCDPSGSDGFDPISLISKVSSVECRPAVKLSDNYAKALGPPVEIERYRRVFGTVGVSNIPVIA